MVKSEDEQVSQDLIEETYRLIPVGLAATVVNGTLVAVLHWNLIPRLFIIIWLGITYLSVVVRFLFFYLFQKNRGKYQLSTWRDLLILSMVVSGTIWGSAAFFVLFHDSLPHDVLIAFVLGGMMAGASATYSALMKTFYAFTIPALIPVTVLFFISSTPVGITMATMLILFSTLVTFIARSNHKVLESSFRLRYEKMDLISQLKEEKIAVSNSFNALQKEIKQREKAEKELYQAHSELEMKVRERTAELSRTNEKLQESNSELSAFTHTVSHDLRAPLLSIDGLAVMLQEDNSGKLDATGLKSVEMIRRNIRRMNELISDLLTFSRIGQTELKCVEVNLSGIVNEIIASLKLREPQRVIEITVQPDCNAECDPKLLKIALENLLQNAWKFTGKTVHPSIEFGMKMIEGNQVFYVSDNGAGFDMADSTKLFIPFQRLHSNMDFPGTGIGLATVKRIVRLHGGKIWAESSPGQGATFYFTLVRSEEDPTAGFPNE